MTMAEEKPLEGQEKQPEVDLSPIDQADLSEEKGLRSFPVKRSAQAAGGLSGRMRSAPTAVPN